MLNGRMFAAVALMGSIAMGGLLARANEPIAAANELVEYRLEKWKTTHAEPGKEGEKLVETLKKLRC